MLHQHQRQHCLGDRCRTDTDTGVVTTFSDDFDRFAEAMLALVLMEHALRQRAQNQDVESGTPVIPALVAWNEER